MSTTADCTTPPPSVEDLTKPDQIAYNAQVREGNVVAAAALVRSSIHSDGRFMLRLTTYNATGRPLGVRQAERAAVLLAACRQALWAAMDAAGWRSEERIWLGAPVVFYYAPAPAPDALFACKWCGGSEYPQSTFQPAWCTECVDETFRGNGDALRDRYRPAPVTPPGAAAALVAMCSPACHQVAAEQLAGDQVAGDQVAAEQLAGDQVAQLRRELEARTAERNSWREAARGFRAERDKLRLELYDLRSELAYQRAELPPASDDEGYSWLAAALEERAELAQDCDPPAEEPPSSVTEKALTPAPAPLREAPRPGYRRAYLAYKLGLGHVTGYTWLAGSSFYRRPMRRSAYRKGWR